MDTEDDKTPPEMTMIVKDGPEKPVGMALRKLCAKGWGLSRAKSVADAELKRVNEKLHESVEPGTALLAKGQFRATVSETFAYTIPDHLPVKKLLGDGEFRKKVVRKDSFTVRDAKALKKVLGAAKFRELIDVKTSYEPSPALIEMADGSDETARQLRAMLSLKTTKSVRWLAQKPEAGTVSVKTAAVAAVLLAGGLLLGAFGADAAPLNGHRDAIEALSNVCFADEPEPMPVSSFEHHAVCTLFTERTPDDQTVEWWACFGVPDGEEDARDR